MCVDYKARNLAHHSECECRSSSRLSYDRRRAVEYVGPLQSAIQATCQLAVSHWRIVARRHHQLFIYLLHRCRLYTICTNLHIKQIKLP